MFLDNYRHTESNKTVLVALKQGNSCCYNKGTAAAHAFVLFAVYQNVKTLFSKTNFQCMPERYFLKTPWKWFRLLYQIEQERFKLSGTTTTSQVPEVTKYTPWLSVIDAQYMCLFFFFFFFFGNTGGPGPGHFSGGC